MDAMGTVVERFKEAGLHGTVKDTEGGEHECLFNPHAFGSELDVEDPSKQEARILEHGITRLEELRGIALRMGISKEKTEDDTDDDTLGFKDRLVTFTASDETVDRYGDIISVDGRLNGKEFPGVDGKGKAKGWLTKTYQQKNPVFMAFHEYAPFLSGSPFAGMPIGQALDTWPEVPGDGSKAAGKIKRKRLRQTVLFSDGSSNPLAPMFLNAYKIERTMRSVSVGFMPQVAHRPDNDEEAKELGLGKGVLFLQQELWENSAVSIPANPNAVQEHLARSFDMTNPKGVKRFADGVADLAPEFAYAIRSVMPTERKVFEIKPIPDPVRDNAMALDAALTIDRETVVALDDEPDFNAILDKDLADKAKSVQQDGPAPVGSGEPNRKSEPSASVQEGIAKSLERVVHLIERQNTLLAAFLRTASAARIEEKDSSTEQYDALLGDIVSEVLARVKPGRGTNAGDGSR